MNITKNAHFSFGSSNSSNPFQNQNNRKARHSFTLRPLIFKFQQKLLKFIDIYVSRSSPNTELETNFLNLENRSFEFF